MAASSETVQSPDSETHLGDHAYLSHQTLGLNQLRHQSAFCDVTIIVGGQRFPAHKAVLACASVYFNSMFTSGFQESATSEVTLPVSEKSFGLILDFAYTGYFILTPKTAIDVLKTACFMIFTQAIDNCAAFLSRDDVKDKLPIEDCLELLALASCHDNLASFAQIYRNQVATNFHKCLESELFLEHAILDAIKACLTDEGIETDLCSEEQILQGTINWLRHKWEQRKTHAADLLKNIRLGLVPVNRLKEILGEEILAIRECGELVEEVMRLLDTSEGCRGALVRSHPEWFASRNTITVAVEIHETEGALFIGSYLEKGCHKLCEMAEIDYPSPYPLVDSSNHSFSLLVTEDNQLCTAGGNIDSWKRGASEASREVYHNWISQNNFFKYDSEGNKWDVLPPMLETTVFPVLVELNGYIYSMDRDDRSYTGSVQRYNIASKTWEMLTAMHQLDCYIKTAVVVDERILCMGIDKPSLDEREDIPQYHIRYMVYDPFTNQWARVEFEPQQLCDNANDKLVVLNSVHVCYLAKVHGGKYEVYQLLCDLRQDNPRVKVGDFVDQDEVFGMKLHCYGIPPKHPQFTFDKLKMGMRVKSCYCFHHKIKTGRIVFDYPFSH